MFSHVVTNLNDLLQEPVSGLEVTCSTVVSQGFLERAIVRVGPWCARKQVRDNTLEERNVLTRQQRESGQQNGFQNRQEIYLDIVNTNFGSKTNE